MSKSYLNSVKKQFEYYKNLGDNTFDQLDEDHFFWESHPEGNSVAIIVKHMVGNMMSRWTNFFTEDGEKPCRDRDDEFVNSFSSKQEVIDAWKKGWDCLFDALSVLKDKDLESVLYIRNQGHRTDCFYWKNIKKRTVGFSVHPQRTIQLLQQRKI